MGAIIRKTSLWWVWLALLASGLPYAFAADSSSSSSAICDEYEALYEDNPTRELGERLAHYDLPLDVLEKTIPAQMKAAGYRNIQRIGAGGVGIVFRATDRTGRVRAFKFLHRSNDRSVAALAREVQVMNYLNSKDPRFHAARHISISDGHYIFNGIEMDYQSGSPLDRLIDSGYFDNRPDQRAEVSRQLHDLVRVAHANGVWHQDLKPRNVVVDFDSDGKPVVSILDWGLAMHLAAYGGAGLVSPPQAGNLQGTLGYIPEERFLGESQSERDDVFAMRIVDWRMRLGGRSTRDRLLVRSLFPEETPHWQDAPTLPSLQIKAKVGSEDSDPIKDPNLRDSSNYKGNYKEPAFALDDTGTLAERVVAMAEWSQTPNTISERERLLAEARTQSPAEFLEAHGQRLRQAAKRDTRVRSPHVLEVLGSTLLVESLHPSQGLKLAKEEIEAIAQEAAHMHVESRIYETTPYSVPCAGPHHMLRYAEMKQQINWLQEQGLIDRNWNYFVTVAKSDRDRPPLRTGNGS